MSDLKMLALEGRLQVKKVLNLMKFRHLKKTSKLKFQMMNFQKVLLYSRSCSDES